MATVSAFHYQDPQAVFDDIQHQFTLNSDTLIGLTKAFLDEFKLGLGSYNQPMAMMCVGIRCLDFFNTPIVLRLSPESRMGQKLGEFCFSGLLNLFLICLSGLFWHSILVVQTCKASTRHIYTQIYSDRFRP